MSRVVRYTLDEGTMEASQIWSWDLPYYTGSMGDVDLLADGNVVVTSGGSPDPDQLLHITEVDPSGRVVFQMEFEEKLYRSARVPSIPW